VTVDDKKFLTEQFETQRSQLRAVAYRMLGSTAEADDAVQEAWLRLNRSDVSAVQNLGGWLTTVVSRVSLDMLRSRRSRRENELDEVHIPDPVITALDEDGPEHEALLADSVGLALLVLLETLPPAERLAFVLHDMFALPFEEIAPIVERTPEATRQLASRARRRVQGAPVPDDRSRQRQVVDAFVAASRAGDFEALVALLDPDIVLRADFGSGAPQSHVVRGAAAVAQRAATFRNVDAQVRFALVNGAPGTVSTVDGRPFSILAFTVANGLVVEIDILADPARLAALDLSALDS
jgi:RNA polymerase sigma-70 factor (ECF subfamily)